MVSESEYSILYDPFFWVALFALIVNFLLYHLNKKTFALLYEKPHIHIKNISIAPKHKSPDGMIPDGTHIDIEIINPSSFQNLILSRKVSFFPFLIPILYNDADIPVLPFRKKNHKILFAQINVLTSHLSRRREYRASYIILAAAAQFGVMMQSTI